MEKELLPEVGFLRTQVYDLENRLRDPEVNDPQKLGQIILEACSGLLSVLESLQSNQPREKSEYWVDEDLRLKINRALLALEQSQRSLEASEARYRAIVESQTELICRFTPDGALTFYNEAFRRYFVDFGELAPGLYLSEYLPADIWPRLQSAIASLTPFNSSLKVEYSYQSPAGDTHWLQWTCLGTFNDLGTLLEIQAVGHDITDHKTAEMAIKQHNRELSALHAATAALLTTLDSEALLSQILDAAISAIPAANKGTIHLIAQDTGQLEMRASVGYTDPRIRRIRMPTAVGFVARSVRERAPLLIPDLHADPANLAASLPELKDVHAAIVAPLILKGQVLGAISLEATQPMAFNESDLRLLVSFAATATAAIHNARLHAEVQKLAITDALTGLYNRRGLFELGQREVERARRYKRPLVAVMMDIDNFKYINDVYGHAIGDVVLQVVAKRCSDNLRRIDILGRLGGDEFTILLPETDMFTASHVAERVHKCIGDRPIMTDEGPINVSVSMGVARATSATPDLEVLITRADSAMYQAKRNGGNRVSYG